MARKTIDGQDSHERRMDDAEVDRRLDLADRFPKGCLQIARDTDRTLWPTSLEVGSKEWQAAIVNAGCTPDVKVGPEWSEPFLVRDWLVMIRQNDKPREGWPDEYVWLALFCADGTIVGTSSETARHQFSKCLRTLTPEDWQEGVLFKIRGRLKRDGNGTYHELRMAY